MDELFDDWGNLLCAKAKVLGDNAEAQAAYHQAFEYYAQALALNPQKASAPVAAPRSGKVGPSAAPAAKLGGVGLAALGGSSPISNSAKGTIGRNGWRNELLMDCNDSAHWKQLEQLMWILVIRNIE